MANQDNDNGFEPLDMDTVANQEGQLKVVMCGKVQTGKSSLINSLAGTEVAKECLSPKDQSIKCNAYGTQVTIHDGQQKKTINVLLWDSPGLGGAFGNSEENLHQVVEKAKETDLLVYCLDMRMRLEQDDVDGIVRLTSCLRKEMWRNAVFALTYANGINPPPHSTADKILFFQRSLSEWEVVIKQVLRSKAALYEDEVSRVAVVPVGYRNYQPPDRSDWLTPFWREVFRKMKANSLLEGIDPNNITVGTLQNNWLHIGMGVLAGVAVGALTGGIGLGVVGAAVGSGLGGVGGGATVAIVKHVIPSQLYKKEM